MLRVWHQTSTQTDHSGPMVRPDVRPASQTHVRHQISTDIIQCWVQWQWPHGQVRHQTCVGHQTPVRHQTSTQTDHSGPMPWSDQMSDLCQTSNTCQTWDIIDQHTHHTAPPMWFGPTTVASWSGQTDLNQTSDPCLTCIRPAQI